MKALKKLGIVLSAVLVSFCLILVAQDKPQTEEKAAVDIEKAKEKFLEAKCNTCHAFSDLGIEAKNKSANNKAPDFSKLKIEYNKDFLLKYLHKEEELNNKKHPVAFKGTDEDLDIIMALILNQSPKNEENKENQENKKE